LNSHRKHLHHLFSEVIDDIHCDAVGGGFRVEGAGGAVEGGPRIFVDLGLEGGFE